MRFVLVSVARETGPSLRAVSRQPYALTLWTFFELQEMQLIDRVQDLGRRLDLASMVAIAFHEPKKLGDVERRYQSEAGLLTPAPEALERGRALVEELFASGVLSDLVPADVPAGSGQSPVTSEVAS